MRVLVEGSGGSSGWPEPGCRCASCLRADADAQARERSAIVIDETVRLGVDGITWLANGGSRGYRVVELEDAEGGAAVGGWEVTSGDGERLLYPAGPGAVPVPPEGAGRYHVAFLDVLGAPAQLGGLRARGLITRDTVTAVAFADHRVPSEHELRQWCRLWRVRLTGDGDVVASGSSDSGSPRRVPWRVLVLGGARSGKSERAELRLAGEPQVTYVATGPSGAGDAEWAARVAAHRARRPPWWRTVETADLAGVLASARGAVLIDGLGTWLAAVMGEPDLAARTGELVAAWRRAAAHLVAVSDETGLGVVPGTPAGRLFRDELGRLNRALAAESEETELVVAGRVLPLG